MKLRYYQDECVQAVISAFSQNKNKIVVDLCTGSGKSLIVAELARLYKNDKILCVQPSKELCSQNYKKFIVNGGVSVVGQAGYFSASLGKKDAKKRVIYGTSRTIANHLEDGSFNDVSIIIFDEAHIESDLAVKIIDGIGNENIKVLGLSATPYRLNTGYVYKAEPTLRAYYNECVYNYSKEKAIHDNYVCPVKIQDPIIKYDTSNFDIKSTGDYDLNSDKVKEQNNRLTFKIIQNILSISNNYHGIMIFAQTIPHAEEILTYLPESESAIITSKTPKKEREQAIKLMELKNIKYMVNVATLTTGFDMPHVDLIAILRPTTSVGLIEQIIGRGLRLSPETNKTHCTVIDYAENIERLYDGGDLSAPIITVKESKKATKFDITCPICATVQKAAKKVNIEGWQDSEFGYWLDGNGIVIEANHFKPKCDNEECNHFWTYKECEKCKTKNTLTSRYCRECRHEIVDPNKKLVGYESDTIENDLVTNMLATLHLDKNMEQGLKLNVTFKGDRKVLFFIKKWNVKKLGIQGGYKQILAKINKGEHNVKSIDYYQNKSNYYEIVMVNKFKEKAK